MFLNEVKIIDHIHMVTAFVAVGNLFQVFAWKIFTFITELDLVVQKQFAFLLNNRALLVSRTAPFAVRHFHSFSSNIMFQSKVVTASSTVHTTGRYKLIAHVTEHFN